MAQQERTTLSDHPNNLVLPTVPTKAQSTHDSIEWSLAYRSILANDLVERSIDLDNLRAARAGVSESTKAYALSI